MRWLADIRSHAFLCGRGSLLRRAWLKRRECSPEGHDMIVIRPRRRLALTILLSGVALSACQKQAQNATTQPVTAPPIAALPLATAAPPSTATAPAAAALPWPSRPVGYAPTSPKSRYRYLDQAYAESEAFGDTPPDYT